jgi:hypothetical protein
MNVGIHVGHLMGIHTINTWGKGAGGGAIQPSMVSMGATISPSALDFVTYFSFFFQNLASFY